MSEVTTGYYFTKTFLPLFIYNPLAVGAAVKGIPDGGQPVLQLEVGAEGFHLKALSRGVVELVRVAKVELGFVVVGGVAQPRVMAPLLSS